jgi:bla regulator protein blaR1
MIGWLIESLAGFTLMLLLVLAVRRPMARLFGAGWAYAAWLLPLLYLVLPQLPSLSEEIALPPVVVIMPAVEAAAAPLPTAEGPSIWIPLALALWGGGAILFLLWQWLGYRAFLAEVLKDSRPASPPAIGGIELRESEAVDGPLALGFLKRLILVPADFGARYSEAERRLALAHECIHHSRGDIWWNLAALVLLALNWFNPVAWFAFRAFRADQELACDAAVAARASHIERHDYATALVKSASRPGMVAACPLNGADILKRRLKMMKLHRGGWARSLGGVSALAVVGLTGALLSSPGQAHPEKAAPQIVLHAADAQGPIIDRKDLETLKERCADGPEAGRRNGAIICDNGKAVDDPEVRRIVVKTMERARAKVAEARLSAADHARIAAAVAKAHEELARSDHGRQLERARRAIEKAKVRVVRIDDRELKAKLREAREKHRVYRYSYHFDDKKHEAAVREALDRAREQLAHLDIDETRRVAIASAMAAANHEIARARVHVIDAEEIKKALEAARRDIEVIDLSGDMERADEELKREIERLRADEQ